VRREIDEKNVEFCFKEISVDIFNTVKLSYIKSTTRWDHPSIYRAIWALTDTLLSTCLSVRLTGLVVYWAAASTHQLPCSRLLQNAAWSTDTKLNWSQLKVVCWATNDGAEVWAYVQFCHLCYVQQEAPLAERQDISWE